MVATTEIFEILQTIPYPEMPISITDLGLIEDVEVCKTTIRIKLLPTFIGCFALPAIAKEIKQKLIEISGIDCVEVEFVHDPPWSTNRITDAGRASLAEHGIAVPDDGSPCPSHNKTDLVELSSSAISCPWCDSTKTTLTSPFGPTRCKSIYFCDACRQPFERFKKV
jgi:ring-1,2-phenylacetyl-CoA epoxidase subunit PaaD